MANEAIKLDSRDEKRIRLFFNTLGNEITKEGEAEIFTIANNMRNHMIRIMRQTPRTGIINKRIRRGTSSKRMVKGTDRRKRRIFKSAMLARRSSPGNPPAPDTNNLIDFTIVDRRSGEIEVGVQDNVNYAPHLEDGTENMEARPFVQPTIEEFSPTIELRVLKAMEIGTQQAINRS
jgi:hypothetical protein